MFPDQITRIIWREWPLPLRCRFTSFLQSVRQSILSILTTDPYHMKTNRSEGKRARRVSDGKKNSFFQGLTGCCSGFTQLRGHRDASSASAWDFTPSQLGHSSFQNGFYHFCSALILTCSPLPWPIPVIFVCIYSPSLLHVWFSWSFAEPAFVYVLVLF